MTASPVLLLQIKYNKYGSKTRQGKADLERQNKENTHIFTKANEEKGGRGMISEPTGGLGNLISFFFKNYFEI